MGATGLKKAVPIAQKNSADGMSGASAAMYNTKAASQTNQRQAEKLPCGSIPGAQSLFCA